MSSERDIAAIIRNALDPETEVQAAFGWHDDDETAADHRTPDQRERDATAKLAAQIQGQDDAELIRLQDEHGAGLK